jgi:PGF-pre-PGF domain-containing protein
MKNLAMLLSSLMIALSFAALSMADEPPSDIPVYYFGWAHIDGVPAPDGTAITAESGGIQAGTAIVPSGFANSSGYYHIYVNSSYSGRTVTFKVNGSVAMSLTLPGSGSAGLLNLSVATSAQEADAEAAGAGPGGGETEPEPLEASETGFLGFLDAGQTKTLTFLGDVLVRSITLAAREKISGGSVTVRRVGGSPQNLPALDGIAYGFLEITTTAKSDEIENITIAFAVSRVWIADNGINGSTVSLNRYTGAWEFLPTRPAGEETDCLLYEAASPGLSLFAVTGKEMQESCEGNETKCFENNELKICEGGVWRLLEKCQHGCDPAGCLPGPAACAEGEKRCSDSAAETCVNGAWAARGCLLGCSGGECVKADLTGYLSYMLTAGYLPYLIGAAVLLVVLFIFFRRKK